MLPSSIQHFYNNEIYITLKNRILLLANLLMSLNICSDLISMLDIKNGKHYLK